MEISLGWLIIRADGMINVWAQCNQVTDIFLALDNDLSVLVLKLFGEAQKLDGVANALFRI